MVFSRDLRDILHDLFMFLHQKWCSAIGGKFVIIFLWYLHIIQHGISETCIFRGLFLLVICFATARSNKNRAATLFLVAQASRFFGLRNSCLSNEFSQQLPSHIKPEQTKSFGCFNTELTEKHDWQQHRHGTSSTMSKVITGIQ